MLIVMDSSQLFIIIINDDDDVHTLVTWCLAVGLKINDYISLDGL